MRVVDLTKMECYICLAQSFTQAIRCDMHELLAPREISLITDMLYLVQSILRHAVEMIDFVRSK